MGPGHTGRGVRGGLFVALTLLMVFGSVEAPADTVVAPGQTFQTGVAGETRWARQSIGTDSEFSEAVAIDRDGNSILIGSFFGAADFGGVSLPAPANVSASVMVKYAPDGSVLWARTFGPPGAPRNVNLSAVVADSHRNITVVGTSDGEVNLGDGPLPAGAYLAQFSPTGALRWTKALPGGPFGFGPSLAVDREDHLVLAGSIDGTMDFGGGTRAASPESAFVAKYTRHGSYVWDRVFDTEDTSHFAGVAADSDGNIYVAGFFVEEASFGGDTFVVPPGVDGAVVAGYSPSGEHLWSKTAEFLDDDSTARFADVAVHGNRVVVVGSLRGSIRFDGQPLTAVGSRGVMLAYTRSGESRWARLLGSALLAIESDHRDDMTVLGLASVGDDVGTGPLRGDTMDLVFVARFDRVEGEPRWASAFSADGVSFPLSLAVSRQGDTVVSGSFDEPIDFGPVTLTPTTTPDKHDTFLLRLWP